MTTNTKNAAAGAVANQDRAEAEVARVHARYRVIAQTKALADYQAATVKRTAAWDAMQAEIEASRKAIEASYQRRFADLLDAETSARAALVAAHAPQN